MRNTIFQYFLGLRKQKLFKNKKKALKGCPQKKGICLKVFKVTPKKPNSAKRLLLRVWLSNRVGIRAYVPGEAYYENLQQYSWVLIRGGRVRDIPGIYYKAIRNKYDLKGVYVRKNGRSKYGTKDWNKSKN